MAKIHILHVSHQLSTISVPTAITRIPVSQAAPHYTLAAHRAKVLDMPPKQQPLLLAVHTPIQE